MKYGIIFWGNSSVSKKVFSLQKKIVRIRLQILTFLCEYIYSLISYIINTKNLFQMNTKVHSVNIRYKHCLHKQIANLSCFQKSAYYAGIKIFSSLPSEPKSLRNEKAHFQVTLKQYLYTHSFYSVDEYLLSRK
jgi:hypothetical protein